MFSQCSICGYKAEPQDIWCAVCPTTKVNGRTQYVRMTSKVSGQ